MSNPNNLVAKLASLSLKPTRLTLTNLAPKNASNTPEQVFMKNLKDLREYLVSMGPKTKDGMISIFNNSESDLAEALNTIYWEGGTYQTVFFEYCTTI